jgi:putative pre-16S rRNA nuclease
MTCAGAAPLVHPAAMRTLGIDHGQRRVGLALSDEDGRIAHPHSTLARRNPDELIVAVAELVGREGVEEIVVGLPLCLDGSEGASARRARRFAERVGERTGVPIVLWDERMTTLAAERALREAGVRRSEQKHVVDRVAAALLLQGYLDAKEEREERWRASGRGPEDAEREPDEPSRGR